MKQKKSFKWCTLEWIGGIWVMLAMVSLSALIMLNSTFIYRLVIDYFELPYTIGLTRQALMENYQQIVTYLQLPWVHELQMPDFPMSETGRIHFEEVKDIFQILYVILISFVVVWVIAIIKHIKVLPIFNKGVNLVVLFFGAVGILMAINFSQAFVWFHKLFFNNDYWVFNAATDPVILALPEELFMVLGIGVLVLLIIQCILIKFLHTRYRER